MNENNDENPMDEAEVAVKNLEAIIENERLIDDIQDDSLLLAGSIKLMKEPQLVDADEKFKLYCTQCLELFKEPADLKVHRRTICRDATNYRCPVRGCVRRKRTSFDLLRQHLIKFHKNMANIIQIVDAIAPANYHPNVERPFVCNACGMSYKKKKLLANHKSKLCTYKKKLYECPFEPCFMGPFNRLEHLREHVTQHHPSAIKPQCIINVKK